MANPKTFSQKTADVTRNWYLIDASEAPLGRVATQVAKYLIGKDKPTYTPHIDGGDYVVVINAKKTVVTGNKEIGKVYYRHSGFPGGIKDATLKDVREKNPTRIIEAAVKGMIPRNKLASERLNRLRVFEGEDHPHAPQQPKKVEVK
ncbi:50S ribosomal protein L13 [Candidatus Saccharibacteria bacterium]|nr:50S ribosomal protein L13 [Candidatus Saccharibacteria bacterium]NCS82836.1 50S ribosomal protein L13 [Candidatus Saccharibacteria bacterium]